MYKVGLIPLVHLLTGFLHILSESWRSTAEHADLSYLQDKKKKKKSKSVHSGMSGLVCESSEGRGR